MTITTEQPTTTTEPDASEETTPPQEAETAATETGEQDTPEVTELDFGMVPVGELSAHPGNVRTDLKIKKSLVTGIRKRGVRQPLLVNRHPDGRLEVVIGHRRLAAAIEAGRETVPCVIEDATAKHAADDYLDMHTENTEREDLTALEDALALFSANEAGYSMTKISRETGLKPEHVKAAFAAATVTEDAQEAMGDYELDVHWWALIKEFEDDPELLQKVKDHKRSDHSVDYAAERVRKIRAEKEEQDRLVTELQDKGYNVIFGNTLPTSGTYLWELSHDGKHLTEEMHAECPGRGVIFRPYEPTTPVHWCDRPTTKHGHTDRYTTSVNGSRTSSAGTASKKENTGPSRKFVRDANEAWKAAAVARQKFLIALFDRKTPPREVDEFVVEELLTMPEPLRKWLGGITSNKLFRTLMRHNGFTWHREDAQKAITKETTKRRALLRFAPLAAAYEYGLSEASESKQTWRPDKWSPMDAKDAGRYFLMIRACGHKLAPIETALANGKPYTGDHIGKPLIELLADNTEEAEPEDAEPEDAERCADPDCRYDPADPSTGHSDDCQVTAWTEPEEDPEYGDVTEQDDAA